MLSIVPVAWENIVGVQKTVIRGNMGRKTMKISLDKIKEINPKLYKQIMYNRYYSKCIQPLKNLNKKLAFKLWIL